MASRGGHDKAGGRPSGTRPPPRPRRRSHPPDGQSRPTRLAAAWRRERSVRRARPAKRLHRPDRQTGLEEGRQSSLIDARKHGDHRRRRRQRVDRGVSEHGRQRDRGLDPFRAHARNLDELVDVAERRRFGTAAVRRGRRRRRIRARSRRAAMVRRCPGGVLAPVDDRLGYRVGVLRPMARNSCRQQFNRRLPDIGFGRPRRRRRR